MEEYNNNEEVQNEDLLDDEEEEEGLAFSDKLVGVFSEPVATFTDMAKFPTKFSDWFIPALILIMLSLGSQFLITSNPILKQKVIEQRLEMIESQFDQAVEAGQMSQNQADQRMEMIRDNMDQQMGAQMIIGLVIGFFAFFIFFFIVAGYFFLIAKFVLKGDGTYGNAMTAIALPYYILMVQAVVTVIVMMATDDLFVGVNLAALVDAGKDTYLEFLFKRIDVFSIWYYTIAGIGLAKLFKAENWKNYVIAVIASWIGVSSIVFALSTVLPFLKNFLM